MSPSIYKSYTDVNNECPLNRHSVILNKKRVPKGTLKVISYNLTLGSSPSYDDSHIHIIYMYKYLYSYIDLFIKKMIFKIYN